MLPPTFLRLLRCGWAWGLLHCQLQEILPSSSSPFLSYDSLAFMCLCVLPAQGNHTSFLSSVRNIVTTISRIKQSLFRLNFFSHEKHISLPIQCLIFCSCHNVLKERCQELQVPSFGPLEQTGQELKNP